MARRLASEGDAASARHVYESLLAGNDLPADFRIEVEESLSEIVEIPAPYLAGAKSRRPAQLCLKCGAVLMPAFRFCAECGEKVDWRICEKCGFKLEQGASYCGACGACTEASEMAREQSLNSDIRETTPSAQIVPEGLHCSLCGNSLREGARFCGWCGNLATCSTCSSCGRAVDPSSRFCGTCGVAVRITSDESCLDLRDDFGPG